MNLHLQHGGTGPPTVVLLHGLGANAEVWRPLIQVIEREGGWRWLAPDLAGHGRSPRWDRYSYAALAADVAETVGDDLAGALVVGHSLGGVIGLVLAGRDLAPARVAAFGVKVAWSEAELAGMAAQADRPSRVFATREEAVDRALKVAGLHGLVGADAPVALAGVVEADGGWALALDPKVNGIGAPDVKGLAAAAGAEIAFYRGEHDPMQSEADMAALGLRIESLTGLGHSLMVEDPVTVWRRAKGGSHP